MKIHGLQKLTLLDYPGRVACTVFLGGCDLRCPFCHNAELIDGTCLPQMEDHALLTFLRKRTGLLDGVCITGGEPLLHPELPELIGQIRALGYAVKLDTNGTSPDRLKALLDAGLLDYVAMDIKNGPSRYAETVGMASFELAPVRESVNLLLHGTVDYEFRTTVVAELHGEADFREIAAWIAGAKRYYLQPFMDRETVPVSGLSAPPPEALARYAELVRKNVSCTEIRGI